MSLNFKHQRYVKFTVLQIHLLNKYILDTNMIPEFLCHSIQVQMQYVKSDLCKSIFTKDNELAVFQSCCPMHISSYFTQKFFSFFIIQKQTSPKVLSTNQECANIWGVGTGADITAVKHERSLADKIVPTSYRGEGTRNRKGVLKWKFISVFWHTVSAQ